MKDSNLLFIPAVSLTARSLTRSASVSASLACCLFPLTLLACCLCSVHKPTLCTGGLLSRDLPRHIRELVANPNRQIASIFEEPHITSIFQEDTPADKCGFEFLNIVTSKQSRSLLLDPLKQLVRIPLFYLLDRGLAWLAWLGL